MRFAILTTWLCVALAAAGAAAQTPAAPPAQPSQGAQPAQPSQGAQPAPGAAQPANEPHSWLRSANSNVDAGNRALLSGDADAALKRYDAAARELPSEAGVHLNRGLALLAKKDIAKAREALLLGTQPPGAANVRADAYYNLGSAFYLEADAAAGKDDHAQAQQLFRDAVDALKHALKLRPGDRNAAWNLELAQRRRREQEEKQKEKQEQEKQDGDQNQDQQNQDQQDQDQDQQNQDQQKQQDQQQQDQQKPQDQQKQQDQQQQQQQQQQQKAQPEADQPPAEAQRALDALQAGEESLEKLQARQRAMRERRAPAKDW